VAGATVSCSPELEEEGLDLRERTFRDAKCSQYAVNEQNAIESLAVSFNCLDAALVVRFGPIDGEDGLYLRVIQHRGGGTGRVLH